MISIRTRFRTKKEGREKSESTLHATFMRLCRNPTAVFGGIVFIILALLVILAPWLTPYDYAAYDTKNLFQPPSPAHWCGTDQFGRDILTRLLYGGRYSMSMGFIAVGFAAIGGVSLGSICGYIGGRLDDIVMRFLDIFQAIPGILLTICMAAALGNGFDKVIIALSLTRIPSIARLMRGSVMKIRGMEYLEAAEAIGCSKARRIIKYVIPNSMAPVIVEVTMGIASTVLQLATLSYIGLGVQPPTPEWGAMLSDAKRYILIKPCMIMFPGIFIALTVLSLNFLGDGLRDALDPKLKD